MPLLLYAVQAAEAIGGADFWPYGVAAGDAADFDGAVGDFVDFGFEQSADEIRVAAREDDFRAAAFVFDGEHIATDTIADVVIFALDAFAIGHDAFELAEVDHHIVALEAADGA